MDYTYKYPRPAVTADCVVFTRETQPKVLLIERGGDPYKGCWAIPGGFLNMDETTEQCAIRELEEETGLIVQDIVQIGAYSKVDRDPRGRTVTVAYLTVIDKPVEVSGQDDAAKAQWFPLSELPALAFDHSDIIRDAIAKYNALPNGQGLSSWTLLSMNGDEKRELRRKRLMDNKAYQTMGFLTRYMDRYHLDALIGIIPGWGDAIAMLSVLPFVYFSLHIIRSVPLTLAVLNNSLRDVLMGMIPFFVGDVIDFFHRANVRNMEMIQGFVDGDETVVRQVNQRAFQSAIVLILLVLLIVLMIWALVSFGSYLYSFITSLI